MMTRRKKRLVELIRNYSHSHHRAIIHDDPESEERFHKDLNTLVDYIDQVIFLPGCDSCFDAAHPERYARKRVE